MCKKSRVEWYWKEIITIIMMLMFQWTLTRTISATQHEPLMENTVAFTIFMLSVL